MAVVWTLEDATWCNRQGNRIGLRFTVSGLTFTPTLRRSRAVASKVGAIVGWRTDQVTPSLFLRQSSQEEARVQSTALVTLQQPGADWLVEVVISLRSSGLIAANANMSPAFGSFPPAYIKELLSGFIVLSDGNPTNDTPSDAFVYDPMDATTEPLNLTEAVENVGRLPGFDDSGSDLQLHLDAQGLRVEISSAEGSLNQSIDEWGDLSSLSSPHDVEASSGAEPNIVVPSLRGIPRIEFNGSTDFMSRSPVGFDADASTAFGAVFKTSATVPAHIIGRWNDGATADHQWRLFYDGSAMSANVEAATVQKNGGSHTGFSLVGTAPSASTTLMLIYRFIGGSGAQVWANGKMIASDMAIPFGSDNTDATDTLTLGARDDSGLTEELAGDLDQAFVYDASISDGVLTLVMHEMARRAAIVLAGPVPTGLSQPYGSTNGTVARRLDRKPIAVVNLFGGVDYDNNVLGQLEEWRGASSADIQSWLEGQTISALMGCDDYEIMYNRPAGQYADDIIASGIFGNIRNTSDKCVLDDQWDAMEGCWDTFQLADKNNRATSVSKHQSGDNWSRRAWFYTGGGMTLDDNGNVLQSAEMDGRIVAPCTASFYKTQILDNWSTKDTRYRCFFLDSAVQFPGKFVEMVQSSTIKSTFTLVGESITQDANAREGAPWFGVAGLPSAPWWNLSSGSPSINQGYNRDWTPGDWTETTLYFGVLKGAERDLTNYSTTPSGDLNPDTGLITGDNMRFGDIYTFIRKGAIPVAWAGQYAKVGAAWDYATQRIPVSRVPMLSPRISRIWR